MTNDLQELLASVPTGLFINGEFVDAESGSTFEVINPSTGTALAQVAAASASDAQRGFDAVCQAQAEWAATPARERSEILHRTYEYLLEHEDELTLLQSAELGRALADSRAEVAYGAEFFRWFAEEAVRIRGDYRHAPGGDARLVTVRQPVGPCLAITPWNFPLAMGARKIAPALAAGCTIAIKPASKTPLTMLFLAQALREAGLPKGLLSVLPTADSANVSALLEDPRLRKFTFTGSTQVGQELAAQASKRSINTSLELGGNAPYVVFEDADIDAAAKAVAVAKMRGAGQVCIAANRFLVQESIKDEFVERVVKVIQEFTLGPGTAESSDYGPLSGKDQVDKVTELVDDALDHGAQRLLGDSLPEGLDNGGYYYPATVLTNVGEGARIHSEEIFGPVVVVDTFSDEGEALAKANDTQFGLAAYVFTQDMDRALRVAEGIEAGMVAVNKGGLSNAAAPFGGVKESGLGREGGFEGIDEYLETKFIALPL
ncbi:NAD-dependent succinate-semialdehyde dehydrogenase [Corynebacterium tapiri]|uniref:NAD-dependent succinate-semialdehyde dehydrogenase n=1 Tax=Corynebacterium tapiri TaxID=1448266 RepID=A0A5C4U6K9_9CORY|nr:NAD-dependent succinate-semialdehyde dehydrogenase [Corynebacterium tapiri]TNM00409.1 NAD-dependent succinate-semialdehyde dehydrogenase [Corynebacterium tapiri]